MGTIDSFDLSLLRDALGHLYDPSYTPPPPLCLALGQSPTVGAQPIRDALIQAIHDLEPGKEVPPQTRAWRIYDLLYYRFIKGLTQEETAALLGLTSRHIRREQGEALRVLAERLFKNRFREQPPETPPPSAPPARALESANGTTPTNERTQVRREMAALQESAPDQLSPVAETIERTIHLAGPLLADANTRLRLTPDVALPANLQAAIHPSALRQLLIHMLTLLAEGLSGGEIALAAHAEGEWVVIHIAADRPVCAQALQDMLISEILATTGGTMTQSPDDPATIHIALPRVMTARVLLVDDNLDLVHVYRRYTAGTRYELVHTSHGSEVIPLVEQQHFDLIVLDVMLPDIDGWEVLTTLRQHPVGRKIPLVVCSVVREEELALSLGASGFLAKPVRPRQFLQALNQALRQGTTRHAPPDDHSAIPH